MRVKMGLNQIKSMFDLSGKVAEPEDFIGALVYLASPASSMMTGHIMSVDGGAAAG